MPRHDAVGCTALLEIVTRSGLDQNRDSDCLLWVTTVAPQTDTDGYGDAQLHPATHSQTGEQLWGLFF